MSDARRVGRRGRPAIGAVLLFLSGCAIAAPDDDPGGRAAALHVRALAATCAACHGTDGHAVEGQPIVALAGYPKAALIAQMRAFRDGTRAATIMHQIARGYDDAQIDALAAYFAAQPAGSR